MFRRICRFVRKNKGKLFIFGIASASAIYIYKRLSTPNGGGGGGFLSHLFNPFNNNLSSSQDDEEYLDAMNVIQRQEFFEIMLNNSDASAMALLNQIKPFLLQLDEIELIKQKLENLKIEDGDKNQNSKLKMEYWQKLKKISCCRLLSGIYLSTITYLLVRVQWSILAGTLFALRKKDHEFDDKVKVAYVSITSTVIQQLLSPLHESVHSACEEILSNYQLTSKFSLKQLDQFFVKFRLQLEKRSLQNGKISFFQKICPNFKEFIPTSSTLSSTTSLNLDSSAQLKCLEKLLFDTQEIIESSDFEGVLSACCDCAFLSLQECLAGVLFHQPTDTMPLVKMLPHFTVLVNDFMSQEELHNLDDDDVVEGEKSKVENHQLLYNISTCQVLRCFSSNVFESFSAAPSALA